MEKENIENVTIEYCFKMYQNGMVSVISNGKVIGFKEEN